MAIGHGNFRQLLEQEVFTKTKQKKYTAVFSPSNAILAAEIVRRSHFMFHDEYKQVEDNPLYNPNSKQIRMPKPSGWSRGELISTLEKKTIKLDTMDVAFIHSQIYLYSLYLSCNLSTQNLKPESTSWDRGSWEGIVPNVRLIEIVLSDEFRNDFIHRNDAVSRQQLDARGTESQPISFWEKVRRRFNDRTYKINSCPLDANWGRDIFLDIHDCNWAELDALNIQPISDENTCKLHYMNLNNKLGQVYKNWKASGNGDQQICGKLEEADYGAVNLELLPTQGGDRIDFLGNFNICVMYLWFSLIKAGAFLYSQTEFPAAFQADDENAPEIQIGGGSSIGDGTSTRSASSRSSSTRNKKMAAPRVGSEIEEFSKKIDALNNSMLLEFRLDRMVNEKRELNSDIKELQKEIDELFEKKHAAALRVKRVGNDDNEKTIEQSYLNHYDRRYAVSEKNLSKKEKELDELNQKIKIMESRLYEIKEKTPRRSGNCLKKAGRVPSSVNVSDITAEEDDVLGGGRINFDTPAAATTPTATSSRVNRMLQERNNKRKRTEDKEDTPESIDLLAQKTPEDFDEDDDDDDDEELFKKMI
jgi:hypothetical protein